MPKVKAIFVRSAFNYDTNEASDESGLDTGKEGGAKQHFKDECDINTIVKRFGLGYDLPEPIRVPQYADYTNIPDFHTAMNLVAEAQSSFMQLPADLREKFGNKPEGFVAFCMDENNLPTLGEHGLLNEDGLEKLREQLDARAPEPAPAPAGAQPKS